MTSHHFISWAAAAALLLAPLAAAGQHHGSAPRTIDRQPHAPDHAVASVSGKKANIQLSQPTRVAGTLLEPGYYRVQMQSDGDQHVLVLARQETVYRGVATYGIGGGQEVLRVPCVVADGEKNGNTALNLLNEAGVSVLRTVRIKGERGTHVIALADSL